MKKEEPYKSSKKKMKKRCDKIVGITIFSFHRYNMARLETRTNYGAYADVSHKLTKNCVAPKAFFGECKEFNRAGPPKVMCLKKKIIAQYPHPHSKKKNKHVSCFNF
jgi:hypothetical protein